MTRTESDRKKALKTSAFLSRYITCQMAVGVQTSRTERNAVRVAEAYGMRAELAFFPKSVIMTLHTPQQENGCTTVCRIQKRPLNFETNALLCRLGWRIHDRHLPVETAEALYEYIVSRRRYSQGLVVMMVALANASFCRLFQGDGIAMGLVFIATFVGFYIKQNLTMWHFNECLTFMLCSFVSSVFGSLSYLCQWGGTPDIALATSVLYLIPGVPLINGVMDIIDGHIVTGNTRLFNAAMLIAGIALGLTFTLLILGIADYA
ncbi:MAG: threonine/serine exporter family protein [Clostridium sp.]|nr:threonine/serine exporter family protein [Clostridium sp.]